MMCVRKRLGAGIGRMFPGGLVLAWAAATVPVFAAGGELERLAPREPEQEREVRIPETDEPGEPEEAMVYLEALRGITLVPSERFLKLALEEDPVFAVRWRGFLSPEVARLQGTLEEYLEQPLTSESLRAISRTVVRHYRSAGRPVVDVIVPEQEITQGVLVLLVVEGRVDTVTVEGNRHFSEARIREGVRLREGDRIRRDVLVADLQWLNRNPFRDVGVAFAPGDEFGRTDLILETRDRRPWRVYGGYENTGTRATGLDRYFAGFNWGDVSGTDHRLGYQVTTSPDAKGLLSNAASYTVPLPWRHEVSVFGAHARSETSLDSGPIDFDQEGETIQASLRYAMPGTWETTGWQHETVFGFDYKRADNDLLFGGATVFDDVTEVFQAVTSYELRIGDPYGNTTARGTLIYSPGGITDRNENDAFRSVRSRARAEYAVGRLTIERRNYLPGGFSLSLDGTGQAASGPLLPSEQLGAGGADSVRGYDEREARGDRGVVASAELSTPSVEPAGWGEAFRLVAFFDYGAVGNRERLPGEPRSTDLVGAGAGLRFDWNPWASVRLDLARQLTRTGLSDEDRDRAHVSVVVSF